jgi:hypothetical protein
VAAGAIYDIATTRSAATRANEARARHWQVVPTATPRGGGLAVLGAF